MLEPQLIAGYDASRPLSTKPFKAACYAPFNSMYLDTLGLVRACCVNRRYVLGELTKQRLDDIWFGPKARSLRDAMLRDDLRLGCEFCEWQIKNGNFDDPRSRPSSVHAKKYDMFPVERGRDGGGGAKDEYWPTNLEFNLSNTCNLECVTCNGEFSSSIRSRREKLPPLPRIYGDEFFDDLRKYLPRLKTAQFLGGEPFLIQEHYRVWEMMAQEPPWDWVGVTTNGTVFNAKVQRVLDTLPISIVMSMDGVTKKTFEAIRVNAVYETFLENFHRFLDYHRAHHKRLGFNFTLSRLNQHEFADFLLFAESYDCEVNVCSLVSPPEMSLYTLPPEELGAIVRRFDARTDEMHRTLKLNRIVWDSAVANLRHELEQKHKALPFVGSALVVPTDPSADDPFARPTPPTMDPTEPPRPSRIADRVADAKGLMPAQESEARTRAARRLAEWSGAPVEQLVTDTADVIEEAHFSGASFLGLGVDLMGRTLEELSVGLVAAFGGEWRVLPAGEDGGTDQILDSGDGARDRVALRAVILPRSSATGRFAGLRILLTRRAPGFAPATARS
jgi:MoaA/NifB/PqqE/SkfB family radical SAM enzyme